MKVMVIGSGGREHALAWKLAQSEAVDKLYIAPGNAGTEQVGENVAIKATDLEGLVAFAKDKQIDLTVVGPDDPLAMGVVDLFEAQGLKVFGPSQAAAQVEASKVYAKQLMQKQGIPTAAFRSFDDYDEAKQYLKDQTYPLFIKASGLAQGKGAVACANLAEAEATLKDIMVDKAFGEAGDTVVIESYLEGPEISLHALCDGSDYLMLPSSQDHKPVFDGDKGPNTGGMGTVAPLPWINVAKVEELGHEIVEPLLVELVKESASFKGLLYPGLKMTVDGARVIEYNARFGDPETQAYARLLDGDLLPLLLASVEGKLSTQKPVWRPQTYVVNVAMASGGYPGSYAKGVPITGIDEANRLDDVVVFHAGTLRQGDEIVTNGGRVVYVSATGASLKEAQKKAYAGVQLIKFKGAHYRTDIGDAAIAA